MTSDRSDSVSSCYAFVFRRALQGYDSIVFNPGDQGPLSVEGSFHKMKTDYSRKYSNWMKEDRTPWLKEIQNNLAKNWDEVMVTEGLGTVKVSVPSITFLQKEPNEI